MPSPIGHALGSIAAGWAAGGRRPYPGWTRQAVAYGLLGMTPDLDLVVGTHSGETHSLGAAVIVTLAVWGAGAALRLRPRGATLSAVFAAYTAHIVLDWLGEDTSHPFGVMALWPVSREYFMSPFAVMPAITRRYWLPGFWSHNFHALIFELAVLVPIGVLVFWMARRED